MRERGGEWERESKFMTGERERQRGTKSITGKWDKISVMRQNKISRDLLMQI